VGELSIAFHLRQFVNPEISFLFFCSCSFFVLICRRFAEENEICGSQFIVFICVNLSKIRRGECNLWENYKWFIHLCSIAQFVGEYHQLSLILCFIF
jgi:hypothetical protein